MVVGSDERSLEPTGIGLGIAQAHRDGLADFTGEVRRRAQRSFEPWARDLERVVPGDGVLVVEFARDEAGGERQRVERDAAVGSRQRVEGDADGAAPPLDVVDVEGQVGGNRVDEGVHAIDL